MDRRFVLITAFISLVFCLYFGSCYKDINVLTENGQFERARKRIGRLPDEEQPPYLFSAYQSAVMQGQYHEAKLFMIQMSWLDLSGEPEIFIKAVEALSRNDYLAALNIYQTRSLDLLVRYTAEQGLAFYETDSDPFHTALFLEALGRHAEAVRHYRSAAVIFEERMAYDLALKCYDLSGDEQLYSQILIKREAMDMLQAEAAGEIVDYLFSHLDSLLEGQDSESFSEMMSGYEQTLGVPNMPGLIDKCFVVLEKRLNDWNEEQTQLQESERVEDWNSALQELDNYQAVINILTQVKKIYSTSQIY